MTFLWRVFKGLYLLVIALLFVAIAGYIWQLHRGVPAPVLQLASPFLNKYHLDLDTEDTRFSPSGGLVMQGIELRSQRNLSNPAFFSGDIDVSFYGSEPVLDGLNGVKSLGGLKGLSGLKSGFKMKQFRVSDGRLAFQTSDWEAGATNHVPVVLEDLNALIDIDGSELHFRKLSAELAGIEVRMFGDITLGALDQAGRPTAKRERPRLEPMVQSLMPLIKALSNAQYEKAPVLEVDVSLDTGNPAERMVKVNLDVDAPGWIAGKRFDRFAFAAELNRMNIEVKEVHWEHDGLQLDFTGQVKPGSKTLTNGRFVYYCDDETSGFHTTQPVVLERVTAGIDLNENHLQIHQFDTHLAGIDLRISGDVMLPKRKGLATDPPPEKPKAVPLSREALEPLLASLLPIWDALVAARHERPPVLRIDLQLDPANAAKDRVGIQLDAKFPGWVAGLKFDELSLRSDIGRDRIDVRELLWKEDGHHAAFIGHMNPRHEAVHGSLELNIPAPLIFHLLPTSLTKVVLKEDVYIPGNVVGTLDIEPDPAGKLGHKIAGHLNVDRLRYKGIWINQLDLDGTLRWPQLAVSDATCQIGDGPGSGPAQVQSTMNLETQAFRTHAIVQAAPTLLIPLAPANEDLYRSFEFLDAPPKVDIHVGGIVGDKESAWARGRVSATKAVFRSTLIDTAEVDVLFTNQLTTLTNLKVRRPEGNIEGSMTIDGPNKQMWMDIVSTADLSALSNFSGPQTAKTMKHIRLEGPPEMRIRGQVDMMPGRGNHDITGSVKGARSGGFNWIDIKNPNFDWSLKGKTFQLKNLDAQLFDGQLSGGATITGLNIPNVPPALTVNIGVKQARLEQIDIPNLNLDSMEFNGPFDSQLTITGLLSDKIPFEQTMDLRGTLGASAASVRGVMLNRYDSDITYADRVTTFSNIVARSGDGTATGALFFDTPNKQLNVRLDTTAEVKRIAQIAGESVAASIAKLDIKGPRHLILSGVVDQSGANRHHIGGSFAFENGGLSWIVLDQCQLNWSLHENVLSMLDMKGTYQGGPFQGFAAITNLFRETAPQLSMRFNLTDAQLAQIQWPNRAPDNKISGRVSSDFVLRGPIGIGDFQDTMSGEGTVKIRNGDIFSVRLLGGLSDILSKLIPGFGIVKQSDLDAKLTIKDQQAHLEDLKLLGDVLSAKGAVTYNFDHRIDGKIKIELFKKGLLTDIVRLITSPISFFLEVKLSGTTDKPEWRLQKIPKELQGIF